MMTAASVEPVAGACHARGTSANLPAQWLLYVAVENLDQRIKKCGDLGGNVVDGPRALGKQRFCVIRDPAGAHLALIERTQEKESP